MKFVVKGNIGHLKTVAVEDGYITQGVVHTSSGQRVICVWRHEELESNLDTDTNYIISGLLSERSGRKISLQPHIERQDRVYSFGRRLFGALVLPAMILAVVGGIWFASSTSDTVSSKQTIPAETASMYSGADAQESHTSSTLGQQSTYTSSDCDYESTPFSETTEFDYLLPLGQSRVTTYGQNGYKKICYPFGRLYEPVETVITSPVDQVKSVGMYIKPSYTSSSLSQYNYEPYTPSYTTPSSYSGYYNVDGSYVPSPSYSGGASVGGYSPSAICNDGTYSYSQHASGTCSGHGGVSTWY